ncbi:MAG TPA: ISNCY family transposase [Acidobacteriaceae bacterium]|nr:ISNCY family transposase [Acidobacteriaceae bacterium]
MRHAQPSLWEGFLAEEVAELWEPWMREVDSLLEDDELLSAVFDAQGQRHKGSCRLGRHQTPAEVVLRMLLLKHVRNWSYETLEREVRANLVYRSFCRIGLEKVPDAKTLVRLGQAVGPEVIGELHARVVALAQAKGVVQGRKMRVDTTVVETNVHYPTDSTLLGDGARVLTRTMKKVAAQKRGGLKTKLRDRMRTVRRRVLEIGLAARQKGPQGEERKKAAYRRLLTATRNVANQAKRVIEEIAQKRGKMKKLREQLAETVTQVRQVIRQTVARVFRGDTQYPEKLVSIFEPHTEIIRKGKASKPTEFGKMVQIQEAENQVVTVFEVFERRPWDSDLLVPAVDSHQQQFGTVPRLVAADAAFYSKANEDKLHEMGVRHVAVPNRNTRSAERKRLQRQRWFKEGQRWRTGCEGRISVLKRRHGLNRCRYRGLDGIRRWVGLGVIADNLVNIGNALARA